MSAEAVGILFQGRLLQAKECPLCPGHARITPAKALAKHLLRHKLLNTVVEGVTQLRFCVVCERPFRGPYAVKRTHCLACASLRK